MTALRRPSRAAATATFVALPPSDFENVRTSASGTPICSGYRSTPTRPMVTTSRLRVLSRELDTFLHPGRRPSGRLALQHDVLLEDVPTLVRASPQEGDDLRDSRGTASERNVQSAADALAVGQLAISHRTGERRVDVFQVDMAHPRSGGLRDGERVRAPEREVARVEAERLVRLGDEALDLTAPLEHGPEVRMQRERKPATLGDLRGVVDAAQERSPLGVGEVGRRRVPGRSACGGEDQNVRA